MRRRRGVVVTAGAAATVAAVALLRPGGADGPADRPTTPPVTSAADAVNGPWMPGSGGPTTSAPSGTVPPATDGAPRPPHDSGGVSAIEELEPEAAAAAVGAAEAFAAAWATPGPDWYDRLTAYASPSLAASLAGATPVDPAPGRTGSGAPVYATPTWARVRVPTDRGDLILDLTRVGSRWFVSAVDWRQW